jgi:hypothetical protein
MASQRRSRAGNSATPDHGTFNVRAGPSPPVPRTPPRRTGPGRALVPGAEPYHLDLNEGIKVPGAVGHDSTPVHRAHSFALYWAPGVRVRYRSVTALVDHNAADQSWLTIRDHRLGVARRAFDREGAQTGPVEDPTSSVPGAHRQRSCAFNGRRSGAWSADPRVLYKQLLR